MYRTSAAVEALAARLGLKDKRSAVGLIVLLGEVEDEGLLDSLPDALYWLAIGGKVRGASRADVTEAYQEYRCEERRRKEREKKKRQRALKTSPEKGDKNGDMSPGMSPQMSRFEGDTFPTSSPPSPAPFLPPSPPTPPVTPYNPPNPIPRNSTPFKKSANALNTDAGWSIAHEELGINSAWMHSEQARKATAQRVVDWISSRNLRCTRDRNLFTAVLDALNAQISPEMMLQYLSVRPDGSIGELQYLAERQPEQLKRMLELR